ncbi:OsmC family protein [Aestuariirhabdus litorea]|uniref:OsmC family protein n=1 Tax=Aestuariirhabdus litorea TaxID=2528527 RepID=A0A3P3VN46_9GAMM|nr:OsmC family protein [Aestuariirhabdus litorea]RRJ83854.1 OsmC family protein [Aestuariirhabdus litorea]RWW97077.1 OsmC family protein [Endozoicomonadaceae bacterium GTF-13]
MQVEVKWLKERQFEGVSGSGSRVLIDGAREDNQGVRPLEMLLLGVGGCSSYDVIGMLEKARQQVTGCRVEISAERADAVPAVFTRIHLHFVVTGQGLKDNQVKRAVELSAEKYCSASIMLAAGGVEISHDYQVVEA